MLLLSAPTMGYYRLFCKKVKNGEKGVAKSARCPSRCVPALVLSDHSWFKVCHRRRATGSDLYEDLSGFWDLMTPLTPGFHTVSHRCGEVNPVEI